MNRKMRACRALCQQCITACKRCHALLTATGSRQALAAGRDLFLGCARLCDVAREEIRLNSGYMAQVCGLCALLCRACADECRLHPGEQFARCAELCEQVARECRALAVAA